MFGAGVFAFLVMKQGGLAVGIDLAAYLRAGDDLLAGNPVYIGQIGDPGVFSYAPPWAVLFGALAWVPDMVMQVGMMALSLLAIRYVAGSWLWAGLVFWYPVSVMVLLAGQHRVPHRGRHRAGGPGHAGPLAFTALAKVAPIFGGPPLRLARGGPGHRHRPARHASLAAPVAGVDRAPAAPADHHLHPHRTALVRAPSLRAGAAAGPAPVGFGIGGRGGHALAVAGHAGHPHRSHPPLVRRATSHDATNAGLNQGCTGGPVLRMNRMSSSDTRDRAARGSSIPVVRTFESRRFRLLIALIVARLGIALNVARLAV